MLRLRLSENFKIGIVALIVLIGINFWSFQAFDEGQYNILEAAAMVILLLIVIFSTKVFLRKGLVLKSTVLLFLLLPFLSFIGAYVYHHQPINLSLIIWRTNLFWLLYFVLHIFDISTQKVIKLMIFIGCGWALLTTVQQFTYPRVFFYTRGEGSASLFRGNIIRFGIPGQQFCVFVLLYFFNKYLTTQRLYTLSYVGLAMIGLYYTGGRQILGASLACLIIAVLLMKGISKWGYLFLFFMLGLLVVLVLQPAFLTHMIEMTNEQVNNEDYIRYHSARFYLSEYWPPQLLAKFLGNGQPHELCSYGIEMDYIMKGLHFFRSDVGIIGAYNTYGIFYVLTIFWISVKGMFMKVKRDSDKYLRLIFFYTSFVVLFNVGYAVEGAISFFCLLYYLVDKSFQEEPEKAVEQSLVDDRLVQAVA